ncbi:MAG: DUF3147 family protein [Deltaproteobacteria bacterium]|nr:DUF3147 family protein [Deltaproteobacteria bacterium]
MEYFFKIAISALVIAGVAEIGKRFTVFAAIVASLPLTSILAMCWLYRDTKDAAKIIDLSYGIFWAVLPSLIFFLALPFFVKMGLKFPLALLLASLVMVVSYSGYLFLMKMFGVKI